MRTTFGLASLSVVTGFCLVQACSGEDAATQEDTDAGGTPPGTSTSSSSGATSSTSSSGGSTSSTSSSGGADASADAAMDGNLGGLAGADKQCADLAKAAGGGDHTWAAYLSTGGGGGVDAKDRIGAGPWQNQKGVVIAKDVAELHGNNFNVKGADILDETGKTVPAKEHDILTGTNGNGTNNANTCANWTASTNADDGRVGHADSDTNDQQNDGDSWNDAHNVGCSSASIAKANGAGRFYCFAKD